MDIDASSIIILYADEHMTVVHKPAGILVHRSFETSNQEISLCMLLRRMTGRRMYPVHRLDRATSGVMIFANTPTDARILGDQIREHSARKTYLACVRGWTDQDLTIDHPLAEDACEPAKTAVTQLHTLRTVELPHAVEGYPTARYSLVELHPLTGRHHQLRRHMKHIHHPIIGDSTYGRSAHNRFFREHYSCGRLLLHAYQLTLRHPQGETITFQAPPSGEMQNIIQLFQGEILR